MHRSEAEGKRTTKVRLLLEAAADGEGHDRKNRSGQSEIAQTGVQAGMSYYINNTMSIGSDPFALSKRRTTRWDELLTVR